MYCAVCLVQVQPKQAVQRLCSHPFPGAPPGPTWQIRRSRVGILISPGKETPPGLGVGSSRVPRVCGGHKGTPQSPLERDPGAQGPLGPARSPEHWGQPSVPRRPGSGGASNRGGGLPKEETWIIAFLKERSMFYHCVSCIKLYSTYCSAFVKFQLTDRQSPGQCMLVLTPYRCKSVLGFTVTDTCAVMTGQGSGVPQHWALQMQLHRCWASLSSLSFARKGWTR